MICFESRDFTLLEKQQRNIEMAPRKTALKETTANASKTPPKNAKTGAGVKKAINIKAKKPVKKPANKAKEPLMTVSAEEARNGIPGTDITGGVLPASKSKPKTSKASKKSLPKSKTNKPEADKHSDDEIIGPDNPYEYILLPRPHWHCADEDGQTADEAHQASVEDIYSGKTEPTPASKRPGYPWIAMRKSVVDMNEAVRLNKYRCPDRFEMYIYNDFEGYGQMEMIENLILAHDKLLKKGTDIKDLWMQIASFGLFLNNAELDALSMVDDGERYFELMELVGLAFLSALNELDLVGKLGPDSEFKDIPFTMGALVNAGAEHDSEDTGKWTQYIVRYAIDKKINVNTYRLKKLVNEHKGPVSMPAKAGDKWGFKKKLRAYRSKHGKCGGHHFDITKMSSAERKRHAFNGKDPLPKMPKGAFLDFQ